jgi:leucyl-tRNA synthetase
MASKSKKSGATARRTPKSKRKTTQKSTVKAAKRATPKAAISRSRGAAAIRGARGGPKGSTAPRAARKSRAAAKTARPAAAPRIEKYNPQKIEPKWQKRWEKDALYRAVIDPNRKKFYALTMLPYPSGDLHIGHWYAMTPSDARARWMRMRGFNVMFPIGFDAFGLPAENAAIQRGIHPKKWTYKNIANMRRQLRSMGAMWDWEREALSSDPEYYRWSQWFFNQLFKHGLAYKKMSPVDWCPHCQTTLAREQVWGEDRHCERCKTPVIKKNLEQWYFRTTKYAEELLRFDGIDWPERVREMQTNWVGRSEGAEVRFPVSSEQLSMISDSLMTDHLITVFTTRPDTLWGATFMVLAPEHPLVEKLTAPDRRAEVEKYVFEATRQTDIDRESTEKEKTGVFIGAYAVNPVNGARIPIWVADYVLMTYGTGAIMAVPAHDERDFAFANTYHLPIPVVIAPPDWDGQPLNQAYSGPGQMVNSGEFDGTPVPEGVGRVIRWLEEKGIGKGMVTYRLRDWLISRQRYWGAPIPIVYCPEHGMVPVPDEQLPVTLPDDVEWLPTGQSPLKLHPTWAHTTCPTCGKPALRDTDTMDTFMCSSWYHLRYLSPHYDQGPFDPKEYDYWMPVDTYTGGAEHATMHLIYTRFFHKACRDMGITEGHEPMMQLRNQGQILGPDTQRMSKSRGNVIDPDEQVKKHGADTVRAYLMFAYQWSEGGPWSTENIQGVVRWLNRVWAIALPSKTADRRRQTAVSSQRSAVSEVRELRRVTHQTIKRVTEDFDKFEFNTIVSGLMEFTNALYKYRATTEGAPAWEEAVTTLLLLMAPVAPHIAEELWARRGKPYSIHQQAWPQWDPAIAAEEMITIVVQVNGKVRDRFEAPAAITDAEAKERALATDGARRHMDGKAPKTVVYVPGRLVNIVV